jgi:O-antigen/teichoic acid export membrane protein
MSVFLILAAGWIAACLGTGGKLPFRRSQQSFLEAESKYWGEHWKYMRWVLVTAVVFQLTSQGYYWFLAGFLAVNEVANLKAMAILIAPMDQIFIALNYLVLPVMAARYATRNMKGLLPVWKKYALSIAAATLSFALFVRISGKSLVHILYAGRFDNVASLLPTLALLPFVLGIGHTMNAALKAAEMPRLVFYAYSSSGAVTLLLGIPLVSRWGLRGAVYGLLVSGATYTLALAIGFIYNIPARVAGKPILAS